MRFDVRPAATGGWLALAAGPRLLVLPGLDDPAGALDALGGADGFRRAVDLLAARGLTEMPPFVLVETTGEPRLIVRGAVSVTIEDAQGRREVEAASVSTWVEQLVPGLVAVEIAVPGAVEALAADLPVREGVVLVASLRAVAGDEAPVLREAPVEAAEPEGVDESAIDDATVVVVSAHERREAAPIDTLDPEVALAGVAAAAPPPPPPPAPTAADRIDAPPPVATGVVEADPHATVYGPFDDEPAAADEPEPEPSGDGYDYLFGETVFRSVAEAAVPDPSDEAADAAAAPPAPEPPRAGDHDGETVLTTDIAKLRGDRPRSAPAAAAAASVAPPSVVLPSGARERLDQPLIFGRSPSASQVTAGSVPKLITLGSGDQDISRSHVRIALEGDTVVVTDLHSVNGTTVVLPGRDPQRLRAGEPAAVIPGTVVDLGGGVTLTVVEG